jgi:transposase-like protein
MRNPDLEALWRDRFLSVEQSGTSAKQWCNDNGISASLFYYWKHQLTRVRIDNGISEVDWLPAVINEPNITNVKANQDTTTLSIAGATIEIGSGFNPSLLRHIVPALGSPSC